MSDDFKFYVMLASFGAALVLLCVALAVGLRNLRRRLTGKAADEHARFGNREPFTLDQFFEEFYAERGFPRAIVAEVVTQFASAAKMPSRFVRPDDSFQSLTASGAAMEEFIVQCASTLQEAQQRVGTTLFEGQLVTLDDYIRAMVLAARLVKNASA
jgi:hypothetical protein